MCVHRIMKRSVWSGELGVCGWMYELLNWFTSKSNQYISLSFLTQIYLSPHFLSLSSSLIIVYSKLASHTKPRPKNTFRPKPYRIGNGGIGKQACKFPLLFQYKASLFAECIFQSEYVYEENCVCIVSKFVAMYRRYHHITSKGTRKNLL